MNGIVSLGSVDFIFYLPNDPGSSSCLDGPLHSHNSIAVLGVIDVERSKKLFSLRGVFIDFLLREMVKVLIVNFYFESVFGILLEIDPDLFKGRRADYINCKRERQVFGAFQLLSTNKVLANAELGEFGMRVEGNRHMGRLTVA